MTGKKNIKPTSDWYLCLLPVNEQQQGEAPEPPGQSGGRVQVLLLGHRAREQEDLRGLLVGELGGLHRGGVVVNFRLIEKNMIQLCTRNTLNSLLPV